MPTGTSLGPQLVRHVSEVLATDVGRGIARLSRSDMALLKVGFGGFLQITADSGHLAFARCYYIRPEDGRQNVESIQIDGAMRASLVVDLRESVTIVKARKRLQAERVEAEPMLDLTPTGIGEEWLRIFLEDKPVWEGEYLIIPSQGKGYRFRVISVEPLKKGTPVVVTMWTEMKVSNK